MDPAKKIKNIMFVVIVANLALVAYVFMGALSSKPKENVPDLPLTNAFVGTNSITKTNTNLVRHTANQ